MRKMCRLYDQDADAVPERSLALIGAGRPSAWLPGWRKLAAGIVLLLFGGLCGWWGAGLGTEAATGRVAIDLGRPPVPLCPTPLPLPRRPGCARAGTGAGPRGGSGPSSWWS